MGNACARSELEDPNTVVSLKIGPDYKEIPEKLAGTGVKATVSWEATITRAQLKEKREEYWRTRTDGSRRTWMIIKAAVEADAATALTIIQNHGLKMKKGNITLLEDSEGHLYNIPVFMVNNPVSFHKDRKSKPRVVKNTEENIKVKIRKAGVVQDVDLELKNTTKVAELKTMYSEKTGFQVETIKFFFGGKEIKDQDTLAKNFIENEMVIQSFVRNL